MQQYGFDAQTPARKRQMGRLGCVGIALLIIAAIALCGGGTLFVTSVLIEHTAPLPGDASHFDPIASLPAVHSHAGDDTQLIEFYAYYVRLDGTMDLTAGYNARTEYTFVRQVPPPANAPPVGAGGTVSGNWYQLVDVNVYQPGQMRHVVSGSSSYDFINLGMDREDHDPESSSPGDVAPDPKCTFQKLWNVAVEKGAPNDAVATIRYNANGYLFEITDAQVVLTFGMDCKLQGSL